MEPGFNSGWLFRSRVHPVQSDLFNLCAPEMNFSRRKCMGSARPMDWVLCPVPTLVHQLLGRMQGTECEPGCLEAKALEAVQEDGGSRGQE